MTNGHTTKQSFGVHLPTATSHVMSMPCMRAQQLDNCQCLVSCIAISCHMPIYKMARSAPHKAMCCPIRQSRQRQTGIHSVPKAKAPTVRHSCSHQLWQNKQRICLQSATKHRLQWQSQPCCVCKTRAKLVRHSCGTCAEPVRNSCKATWQHMNSSLHWVARHQLQGPRLTCHSNC